MADAFLLCYLEPKDNEFQPPAVCGPDFRGGLNVRNQQFVLITDSDHQSACAQQIEPPASRHHRMTVARKVQTWTDHSSPSDQRIDSTIIFITVKHLEKHTISSNRYFLKRDVNSL